MRKGSRLLAVACALIVLFLGSHPCLIAQTTGQTELIIRGTDHTSVQLTASDLEKMPRKTLRVVNPHTRETEIYEGVPIAELLKRVGVPQGEKLRGAAMASYVVAQASDGYRVVFSLAELDSDFVDEDVIVADTLNGKPLGANQGPFRIVAPHDKRPARWIRMLKSLTVVKVQD